MPRASWKGFLRLSLVSCPIYLSPATTRTKSIRLHQVWQPKAARALSEDIEEEQQLHQDLDRPNDDIREEARPEPAAPARIALLPHDPHFETHETFASRLHAKHGRGTGFWAQVTELSGS